MKLAIIGGRDFNDIDKARKVFKNFFKPYTREIISGGAKGADLIGASLASENDLECTEYLADWKKHGKAAGMIRNEEIINGADMILAFWDGVSKGTANSLTKAKKQKKPCFIVYYG